VKWTNAGEKLRQPKFAILSKLLLKFRRRTPKPIGLPAFGACDIEMMVTTAIFGERAFGRRTNGKEVHLRRLPNWRGANKGIDPSDRSFGKGWFGDFRTTAGQSTHPFRVFFKGFHVVRNRLLLASHLPHVWSDAVSRLRSLVNFGTAGVVYLSVDRAARNLNVSEL